LLLQSLVVSEAIKQYRGHTERDLEDLQLLREQTAIHRNRTRVRS
jgi:hypothetical protein